MRKVFRQIFTIRRVHAWDIVDFQEFQGKKSPVGGKKVIYNGKGENPFWMFQGHPGVGIEFCGVGNIALFDSYMKIRPNNKI